MNRYRKPIAYHIGVRSTIEPRYIVAVQFKHLDGGRDGDEEGQEREECRAISD